MAKAARSTPIDDVIRAAVQKVMGRVSAQIARALAEAAARQIEDDIGRAVERSRGRGRSRVGRGARRPGEITRWVADRRARRVPKFVIEMTGGLDTKKKVVARFGEGAAFEKGKARPRAK
jgi:peptidyl-tRNA hydrolase